MNLKAIKDCKDKTPIDGLRGVVEKQYPPADQTENDLKWSQHRQSLLIHNDDGDKVMVTLMKGALHILDSIEGHELTLTAGRNDKGELRGLLVNRWRQRGKEYDSIVVKVYPEATIRATPPGGDEKPETQEKLLPAGEGSQHSAPARGPSEPAPSIVSKNRDRDTVVTNLVAAINDDPPAVTPFEKDLQLMAYGYCLCLDKAGEMVSDRPNLQADPGSIRAIATNMWMSTKHHVHTLAPGLNSRKEVVKGKEPTPAAKTKEPQNDVIVVDRLIKGYRMKEEDSEGFSAKAGETLGELTDIADQRNLWDRAYDQILTGLIATNIAPEQQVRDAANVVYDETSKNVKMGAEKFFVCKWSAWREAVLEQIGRNEG